MAGKLSVLLQCGTFTVFLPEKKRVGSKEVCWPPTLPPLPRGMYIYLLAHMRPEHKDLKSLVRGYFGSLLHDSSCNTSE